MAGRIRDEDIALVRERAHIAEIVGEHVALRNAGGGELKGLCPFHDERTPSFHVAPTRNFFHCFGCGAGGDVITFVMNVEHLSFAESVERLAQATGVELRYEEGGAAPRQQQGQRTRLVEAHKAAAEFYAEQLPTPDAQTARQFLSERGFDREAAAHFGVGYAPRSWDALVVHLRGRGFTDRELTVGGLAREGRRGPIDRFLGRLLWPIRDITGDVIGFGARRLHDDDRIDAKYVNTPETPIYKKSHILYGLDLAKREIARRQQAVLVEGYTDVMAAHLSGVPTAVATCGTAFGEDHIRILRRLLMDQNEFTGEVVFTFDGDAAGQKAAMRAFSDDQRFVTQTFVAVQPDGLDPCDLRQQKGDAAVRDLVATRVPLFEFAIRTTLQRHDLDIPEGRAHALEATVPLVARIRDVALRDDYARQLAGWVGVPDPMEIVRRVRASGRGMAGRPDAAMRRPDSSDPVQQVEREALKIALQRPALAGPMFDALDADVFTAPAHAAVHAAVRAAGGVGTPAAGGHGWVGQVLDAATDDTVRTVITELTVEPLRSDGETDARYVEAVLARARELAATRRITEVKSRLQRLNPVEAADDYNRLFGELVTLEQHRRALREQAIGAL
ncbi:MAG: DNA primase [Actinomycetes bacterium]